MKTALDHLPASKQEQIKAIAALVQAGTLAEKIILFGSYARGDWVEDLPNAYFSDYDLLVIVRSEAEARPSPLWADLWERARRIAGRIPVSPIVHDLEQINKEIRAGHYFFIDILREGILLFDARRHQLAKPKALGHKERLELAKHNQRYWFTSASEFWRGAGYYMRRGLGSHAAFLLHQTAERYFHAALLVFTGYKPKTHDLALLAAETAPLHPALEGALPRVEKEDERLFELLKKAYIEARYSKSYRVTAEELGILRERTLDLAQRVRVACADKMATFCGADAVGELPEPPSAGDEQELPEAPPLDDPKAFLAWRDALAELSFERGEERGRLGGQAEALLLIFETRGIAVDRAQRETIEACRDSASLRRWIARAMSAPTAEEVLAPSSEERGGAQVPTSE
jgi:predicted nucleotidyltransferase/HEPN domain-containing protein